MVVQTNFSTMVNLRTEESDLGREVDVMRREES